MLYLEVFDTDYRDKVPKTGIRPPTDLHYLQRVYRFNYDSILNYYLTRNFMVKNTNIVSRLIEHFPTLAGYESYRYLEYATSKTRYLAKHFKLTSDIEKGVVHPGYFFGNEGSEVIFSNYIPFNIRDTEINWKTINCINTLKHDRNDTRLLLPLGNNDGSRTKLSFVSINIPMLSIKYREFNKEQALNEYRGEGLVLSKNHFVIKYVLPPMMEDIIDHMFLNKVMDKFYGREEVTPKPKHKFKIFDPTTQINRYVDNVLDIITSKATDYINILRNIPLMFSEDASHLLSYSDLGTTRQIKWALLSSRIDYMIFLYDVSVKSRSMNKHYHNDWKRLIKRSERDGDINNMFPYEIEKDIKEKMYIISQY